MEAPFSDRLTAAVQRCRTPAMVGIDPHYHLLPDDPQALDDPAGRVERFCCQVLEVVAPLVPAVKIQWAFFEQLGPSGMQALERVITYARRKGLLVIGDAKRGDIGSTAQAYAQAFLGADSPWQCDAMTVNPYLGPDTLEPFVQRAVETASGIFVLVKTSNPGSSWLQDRPVPEKPLYRVVAELVGELARKTRGTSGYGCAGAVVGATYAEQLAELREALPCAWLLVPGYGAQGGGAADVAPALHETGLGALINNSRNVLFAWREEKYRDVGQGWQAATEAALREMIEQLRQHTPARNL